MRPLRYLPVITLPLLTYISLTGTGWITFLPLIEAFVLIPFLELFVPPDPSNVSEEQEAKLLASPFFDWMIYLLVPVHLFLLWIFLGGIGTPGLSTIDTVGRITAMGLSCGVFGINLAHELGHRTNAFEQFLAKIMLMTSLYMHFFIEHNRGHHKNVATDEDPSSARLNENIYSFWFRSVVQSYRSAWHLEMDKLNRKGLSFFSFQNEMLWFQIIQVILLSLVYYFFGGFTLLCFILSSIMGFLLLETVNYIEHYGLRRNKKKLGYERVMPHHSWNSDHLVGRMMLFELSRHSDHHFQANRKYQILRHMDKSPQMPTGYPGMMLMAMIPPLWFRKMNPILNTWNTID